MLSLPSAARPSGSDRDFFSQSQSSTMVASSSTDVIAVTTRSAWKKQEAEEWGTTLNLKAPSLTPSSSSSSIPQLVKESKKRKEPENPILPPRKIKKSRSPPIIEVTAPQPVAPRPKARKRATSSLPSSRQSSRPRTLASSPEPDYPSSRSRSVSAFNVPETPIIRPCSIIEDGTPGPGFVSNEDVVRNLLPNYKGFFKNPEDPNDRSFEPDAFPVMELEFPNNHACERYLLLAPKDKDHYHPVYCLEATLYTIIEFYLTPAQQTLFGEIPTAILANLTTDHEDKEEERDESPDLSLELSLSPYSTPSKLSNSPFSEYPCSSSSPLSSLSPLSSPPSSPAPAPPPQSRLLRELNSSIHKFDGPAFIRLMTEINALLRSFKYPPLPADPFEDSPSNILKDCVASWDNIPKKVLERIYEETYQRCVGPKALRLEKSYKTWSNETYGELLPNLLSEMFKSSGLGPDSLFLDLGSGVGNAVLWASLSTGCTSYGIEISPFPADLACEHLQQLKTRCRMWGFSMGDVELEKGDMLKSRRVTELIKKADVVLINNKVFSQSLNEAIRASFLDLKEGAYVISLASFCDKSSSARNVNDISAIFHQTARHYYRGSVSWGNSGGTWYLQRVDREYYRERQVKLQARTQSRSSRPRN